VPWHASVASVVANAASLSLYPLENVKVRFQASDLASNNPIPKYTGIADALFSMYRQEGILTLYRGVLLNLAASSLAQSIFFYAYADGKTRYNFDSN
jgi:solute carrier family 25 citrate transporter 1